MSGNAYNIGALIATMGLDTTQYQAGMASVTASGKAAAASTAVAAKSMTASMTAAAVKMQAVGKKMQRYLTLPILAMGVASTKMFSDFESSMAKIVGLVGVAKSQVDEWKIAVLKLGPATGQGPEKLADALFFITSAGIRGAEAMEVLEMAAKAATAGMGEAATIADLVTSAMNAYGKENLSAAQATDILTATVREGKAEASSLAMAMGMVLPIASEFGVTFDQVGAAFAGMTKTGTNARVAATQLKAILSSMASPSSKAEAAMTKYGTSSAKFRDIVENDGIIEALLHLRKATNGSSVAMAEIFPNIRGLMGVLDLLGANVEGNKAIFDALKNSTGALDTAFESATDTVKFRFNKSIATMKTRMIGIGEAMSGSLIPLIEKLTGWVADSTEKWNALSEGQKQGRIRVLALTAAMGPLLKITGRLIKMLATPKGPYMMAIAGAIALTMAIRHLILKHREEKEVYDAVAIANDRVSSLYESQASKIAYLVAIIEDENISNSGRIEAIKELKRIMPEYNGTLTDEGELINHNTTAIENYLVALKEKIKLQVFEEDYIAIIKAQTQAERDLDTATTAARIAQEKYVEAGNKKITTKHAPPKSLVETMAQVQTSQAGIPIEAISAEEKALTAANVVLQERKDAVEELIQAEIDLKEEMKRADLVFGDDPVKKKEKKKTDGDDELDMLEKQGQARLDLARFIADQELELYVNAYQKKAAAEQLSFERSKSALEKQGADGLLTEDEVNTGIEALEKAHQVRMEQITKDGADAVAKAKADAAGKAAAAAAKVHTQEIKDAANATAAADKAQREKEEKRAAYFESGARLVTALSDLTTMAMNKELAAAGDNAEARKRIQKEYYKKQKKWAIAQAIINGALAVTVALATVPPPASYVLAAISGIAAAAEIAVIASQNFAQGGIVYGETLGRIGEYPGARQNPEVVAPLNRLKDLIQPTGGSGTKEIILRAEGRDLVATIDMEMLVQNTY